MLAAENISLGRSDIMVAGGFESMSNVPYYLKRGDTPYGGVQVSPNAAQSGAYFFQNIFYSLILDV